MSKKLLAFILSLGCIGALTACNMGAMGSSLNSETVSGVESVETPEDGGETPEPPDDGRLELPVVKGEEITKEQYLSLKAKINPETEEEAEYRVLAVAERDKKRYAAIVPENEVVEEYIVLEVEGKGTDLCFVPIEDDDEWEAIASYFDNVIFREIDHDEE